MIRAGLLLLTGVAFSTAPANAEVGKPPLSARTTQSGLPMTIEQRSVSFDRADLAWEVFPDSETIAGDARLHLKIVEPIARIQFDLDANLPVSKIEIGGNPIISSGWRNPDGQLTIDLPRIYRAGETLVVRIVYTGTPHVAVRAPWDGGFVWSNTPSGQPWIATAVQGEGCDLFWPCFDSSEIEIPLINLAITVPEGLSAPSNGRLQRIEEHPDGRRTWHWQALSPNNYSVALNIAPYKEISADYQSRYGNTIPMIFYYLPGNEDEAKQLFTEFAPTLDFFETMIGPYPFASEKLGVVETPHMGMEHQTINAYGRNFKKAPEGYDELFQHEFAHEWFGNQLTNENWDDMWLHEGLGSYMQPLYMEWRGGNMLYMAELWKQRTKIANVRPIVSGTFRTEDQVYSAETGPGGDIYVKGSWVAHTLRGLIGDEAFFRTLRRLVYGHADPKPGNFAPRFSTTAEFQKIASEEAGRDLKWFFDVYLRRAALPKLVAARNGNRVDLHWQTPDDLPFPMPVEVKVGERIVAIPMTDGRATITLSDAASHVVLDPNGKILRQSDDIDAFQAWQAKQAANQPKPSQ